MFFFFKQKTAYEMRISDWSSDVCSSDLNTGKENRVIFQHEEVDVKHIAYSKKEGIPLFVDYITWRQEKHFLDDRIERIYAKITGELPGMALEIVNWDRQEEKFVIRAYADRNHGSYYLISEERRVGKEGVSKW